MLDEKIIEKLTERLVNRIEQGNTYVLQQIGYAINKFGKINPSGAKQLAQILKYGGNFNKIAKKLAEITNLNIKDIYDIFEEVAKENQLFAKQFYDYKNVNYIPYNKNKELQKQVKALAKVTAKEYSNLSNTLAFASKDSNGNIIYKDLRKAYLDTIDEAVLSISQGKDSFQNQMKKTIRKLGQSGIRTVDYESGYSRRLDSAVRMNIQGALRDMSNELQKQFGEEYGADGIEISVHQNPALDHAPIQGHQFSNEEYVKMQNSEPFKDINNKQYTAIKRHISEWNCYHYEFAIVIGVNKPSYTEEELQEIINKNEKGFIFEGKHYTNYEGQQLQRKIETKIRELKDTQIIAKASGNDLLVFEKQMQIKDWTSKYKQLSDVSGLPTKLDRLKVENYKKQKVDIKQLYMDKLAGIEYNGIEVGISNHLIERGVQRKLSIDDLVDAMKNPLHTGVIKYDKEGKPSVKTIGKKVTFIINPESGNLITWYTTGKGVRKKYE